MASHLKMAQVQAIQALREQGWSRRRIARELCIDRGTVGRYIRLAEVGSPSTGPPAGLGGQNQPNPPPGYSGPMSLCEPLRDIIVKALERGLSRQRIWQDLHVADHPK